MSLPARRRLFQCALPLVAATLLDIDIHLGEFRAVGTDELSFLLAGGCFLTAGAQVLELVGRH